MIINKFHRRDGISYELLVIYARCYFRIKIFKQEQFKMIYFATIISASIYDRDFTLVLWNCVVSATDPEYGFLYVVVLNVLYISAHLHCELLVQFFIVALNGVYMGQYFSSEIKPSLCLSSIITLKSRAR